MSRISAVLAALLTLSCEQVVVTTVAADRVDISPATSSVRVSETTRLTVTVLSRDGRTLGGRAVAWTSLDPGIADVDESGTVRGLSPGSATIRATSDGVLGTATVTVTSGPAISAAPQEVDFTAVQNGATPGDRTVHIGNAGDGTLTGLTATVSYTAGQPSGWLTASLSGTAPTNLVLSARQAGLALGTYTANVAVAAAGASNSPVSVSVRLSVLAPQPAIALGATTVGFSAPQGGADPAQQNVGVTNAGGGALTGLTATVGYTSGQPTGWLNATLSAGTAPTTLTLRATTGALPQGSYTATVQVGSAVAQNTPQTVNVTFTVAAAQPSIGVNPSTLSFTGAKGGANPATRTVQLTNTGAGSLAGVAVSVTYPGGQPAGWLTTSLSGTTAPATLTVGAVTGALDVGTYTATIRVASPDAVNSPQSIDVSFQVQQQPASIGVSSSNVSFSTTLVAGDPSPQQVTITNTGSGTLSGLTRTVAYTAGDPTGWLTADLPATTAPTTLTLTARLGSLAIGSYTARVQIAAASASNSPVDITVTFTVAAAPPIAPGAVTATTVSNRRINVSWTDQSNNESRFDVERSNNGITGWAVIGSAGANQTTYADSMGLAASTAYYYRVSACNALGCSPNLTAASATTAPNAPTGLSATAPSHTQVNLTWTAPPEAVTGYSIERRVGTAAFAPLANVTGGNTTTYLDTNNVQASTSYTYRLKACHNALCSAFSNDAPVTTPAAPPPGSPSALDATAVSASIIDLTWTAASGSVQRYYIERKTTSLGTYAVIDSVAGAVLSYRNTGLSALTEYWYRVRACNANGCSGYSNEDAAITLLLAPSAPSSPQATAVSSSQIDLVWGAATGTVESYRIERQTGSAASFAFIGSVPGSSLGYEDTGLAPGTQYFYQVQACNSGGCSGYTAPASATTAQLAPGAPSSLIANAVSAERIDLAWSASAGTVSWYRIERKNNTLPGEYAVIDSVPAGTLVYQSNGLAPLTSYSHRVRACNSVGCSDYSNEATRSTLALPVANAPQNLAATAISSTEIDLAWAHDGLLLVSSFEIERAPSTAQSNFTPIATVAGTARRYVDGGLTSATSYYYRVRACNLPGCSAWSSTANAKTLSPATPTSVAAVATSASDVSISWAAPGGQTYYRIRRRLNGMGTPTVITVSDGTATSYVDSGLTSKTLYTYEVQACGPSSSCSSYSPVVSVTTQ